MVEQGPYKAKVGSSTLSPRTKKRKISVVVEKCYQKLNLNWPDILKDWEKTTGLCKQESGIHNRWNVPFEQVRPDFIEFCKSLELTFIQVCMFHTHLFNNRHLIHIDDSSIGDFAKLNWVYGSNNADMVWYELKDGHSMTIMDRPDGSLHYTARDKDVNEICRTQIDANPTIVKTGILHTAINHSGEDRFVCQVWLAKNNKPCTFNELVEIFKDYII